jgi:hypothetical protein
LALCRENDIPVTVHVAIGTDIVHQHPTADGAVIGQASIPISDLRLGDFRVGRRWCLSQCRQCGSPAGGVSQGPLHCQNLGYHVDNFTTANFDMQQHYRPLQNVVKRPTSGKSKGYTVTGHHEIMLPLLAAGILDRMGTSTAATGE